MKTVAQSRARANRVLGAIAAIALGLTTAFAVGVAPAQADGLTFTATPTPTFASQPLVGQELTAAPGDWEPTPDSFDYQWLADGDPISAATGADYTVASDDLGKVITVSVTATKTDYATTTEVSDPSDPVASPPSDFVNVTAPAITGTAAVGQPLTVSDGAWSPTPDAVAYQWYSGTGSADPVPIPDATASSYTPTAADLGDAITASVTVSAAGFSDATLATSATAPIESGALTPGTPTIAGSPTVGSVLTADPGSWGPGDVALTYQWVQGSSDILGATDSTYTVAQGDAGTTISVRVTGTEDGYAVASATSAPTDTVTGGVLAPGSVSISGDAIFGSTLQALSTTWGPGAVSLGYQWLRDGVAIDGATSSTYALQPADVGAQVSVSVTGTKLGYDSQSVESAQTAPVLALDFAGSPTVTISGPSSLLNVISSSIIGTWSPAPDTVTYQWYRDASPIAGANATSYRPVGADVGHLVTLHVVASTPGYTDAVIVTTDGIIPDHALFAAAPTPTISGNVVVGATLTASAGTWLPTPTALEYTWIAGTCVGALTDRVLQDGTSSHYAVQPTDAGFHLCVRVTATLANYRSTTVASLATGQVALAPLATDVPSISGTAAVGQTLTADAGAWGPAPVALTYQWYRDAAAIPTAVGTSYLAVTADLGHTIHVTVTGTKLGFATSAVSSGATDVIAQGMFAGTEAITASGVAAVGRTLTATVTGALAPAPASSTFAWLRDGTTIPGATKSTYVLTAADAGHAIETTVTSTLDGYASYSATSAPVNAVGAFTTVPTPTITGTAKLGGVLTAVAGTWAPATTPATTFDYAWRVNGIVVQDGATKTYTATTDDVGFPVTVTVTGLANGYAPASATSLPSVKVAAGALVAATPKITGTPKVNNLLTVTEGTWSPTPDSFSYQWNRSGKAIAGATGRTYLLTGADYATTLTVTVTAHLRGYTTLAKASAATAKIAVGTIMPPTTVMALSRVPVVGVLLTVDTSGWAPTPTAFAYQWYSKTTAATKWTAISKATSASYTPVGSLYGQDLVVGVRAGKTGYTTTGYVLSAFQVVQPGTITTATPTISGTPAIGSTLTAGHTGWAPTTSTFHYQWYRTTVASPSNPVPIVGATASTYKVATIDANATLAVSVSAGATGYTASSAILSGQSAKALPAFTVQVVGTPKAGSTVTATPAPATAPVGATYKYQWYSVSGSTSKAIAGATGSTYKISTTYRGMTIKVLVTAAVPGYGALSVYSPVTAKVA